MGLEQYPIAQGIAQAGTGQYPIISGIAKTVGSNPALWGAAGIGAAGLAGMYLTGEANKEITNNYMNNTGMWADAANQFAANAGRGASSVRQWTDQAGLSGLSNYAGNAENWYNTWEPGKYITEGGPFGIWQGTGGENREGGTAQKWPFEGQVPQGYTDDPYQIPQDGSGGGNGSATGNYGAYDPNSGLNFNQQQQLGGQGPGTTDVLSHQMQGGVAPQLGSDINQFNQYTQAQAQDPMTQLFQQQQQQFMGQGGLQDLYEQQGVAALTGQKLSDSGNQYYSAVTKQMDTELNKSIDKLREELGETGGLRTGAGNAQIQELINNDKQRRDTILADMQMQEKADFNDYIKTKSSELPNYILGNNNIQTQLLQLAGDWGKFSGQSAQDAATGLNQFIVSQTANTNAQADLALEKDKLALEAKLGQIAATQSGYIDDAKLFESYRDMMSDNSRQWTQMFLQALGFVGEQTMGSGEDIINMITSTQGGA